MPKEDKYLVVQSKIRDEIPKLEAKLSKLKQKLAKFRTLGKKVDALIEVDPGELDVELSELLSD